MKKYFKYGLLGLSFAFLLSSCEKDEPFFYDANQNGVYFDYENAEEFKQNINFAQHVLGNPTELPLTINLKIVGYHSDVARKAVMKCKEVEGLPLADITIPEIVFEAGESEKEVEIKIARPVEMDTEFAACLYLDAEDPESQLGSAVLGKEEFVVRVVESYVKPDAWDMGLGNYMLGPWSIEKHVFLVNLLEDNNYTDNLNRYDLLPAYNVKAVNAVRKHNQEHPDDLLKMEFPFLGPNDLGYLGLEYDKPYYWSDVHDKYLGAYSANSFFSVAQSLGANTANELELLAGSEEKLQELHKQSVLGMMANYDMYFSQWGMPGISYRDMSWVPMYEDVDYDVTQPACWKPGMMGDESLLVAYYGEYSAEKYKFMIKTWLKKKGTQDFVLVQMFPLVWDWNVMNGVWDDTMGGEDAIKECYKTFKAEYDKAPDGTYSFTFPELSI